MSFFDDLWKKRSNKKITEEPANLQNTTKPSTSAPPPTKDPLSLATILNNYNYNVENFFDDNVPLKNVREFKQILSTATDPGNLEQKFNSIQQKLTTAESYETLRAERWCNNVFCPSCNSNKVVRIEHNNNATTEHNFRYQCKNCNFYFNDDTGTPFETDAIAITTWMQVWYLYGLTNSLEYIAHKLGLDANIVRQMITEMQKIFHSEQPLENFNKYDKWAMDAMNYKRKLQEALESRKDLLGLESTKNPADTAEYRRQKTKQHSPPKPKK